MGRVLKTFSEATLEAMEEEMNRDPSVFVYGEDIVKQGGMWGQFKGLHDKFGDRVRDTPISETALVGAGVGAALAGGRPIIDLHYADFIGITMDEVLNQMAKAHYMFGGQGTVPLVLRAPDGVFPHGAAQHSQSLETWFVSIPGIKVVVPSTPENGKGLLKAAIRSNKPVIFFENKKLFGVKGLVSESEVITPLDKAEVVHEGKDLTIVSYGYFLGEVLKTVEQAEKEYGITIEVIDLRSINPIDEETIIDSVKKTGKLIIAHEAIKTGGVGSEVSAIVSEKAFNYIKKPIIRVGAKFSPVLFSPQLEKGVTTNGGEVLLAIKKLLVE